MGEFKLLLENLEVIKQNVEGTPTAITAVILNFKNVGSVDASALMTFHEMVHSYHNKGIKVGFVEMNDSVESRFKIAGVKKDVGNEYFFESNEAAIAYVEAHLLQGKPTRTASQRSLKRSGSIRASPSPSLHHSGTPVKANSNQSINYEDHDSDDSPHTPLSHSIDHHLAESPRRGDPRPYEHEEAEEEHEHEHENYAPFEINLNNKHQPLL